MHCHILQYLLHINYRRFGNTYVDIQYRINVKIWDFKACCRDLGPFPSTVGGARDLTQQIKLIETSDFQYKWILNRSRFIIIRVNSHAVRVLQNFLLLKRLFTDKSHKLAPAVWLVSQAQSRHRAGQDVGPGCGCLNTAPWKVQLVRT